MCAFTFFGPTFSPLDALLLVLGIGIAVALLRRLRAEGSTGFWPTVVVLLFVFGLGATWIHLEDSRPGALPLPIAVYVGARWWYPLTRGRRAKAGETSLALLFVAGLPFTTIMLLFSGLEKGETLFSAKDFVGGRYRAVAIVETSNVSIVLRPRILTLDTLLDFPSRTVVSADSVGRVEALEWETPHRLRVSVPEGTEARLERRPARIEIVLRHVPDPEVRL